MTTVTNIVSGRMEGSSRSASGVLTTPRAGRLPLLVGLSLHIDRADLVLRQLCTVRVWHAMYSLIFFLFDSIMWIRAAPPAVAAYPSEEKGEELHGHTLFAGVVGVSYDTGREDAR
jgi:hypothetical protein